MYIPKSFEKNNLEELHRFIEKYGFATLISYHENKLHVSHVPTMLDKNRGQFGTLIWHLAKKNDHCKILNEKINSLCLFHGPHSYISPAWYKTFPNVPTWNYTVVHAEGIPSNVSKEELAVDLEKLVSHHESISNTHYQIPEHYKTKLLEHIDGFHMEIIKINGKYKLGQNRTVEDQQMMLHELINQHDNPGALALADFISNMT